MMDRVQFGADVEFTTSELGIYEKAGYEEHLVGYEQTNLLFNYELENYLKKKSHFDDSILDIGCGKGRMLYFFYKCGFGNSDGLEYSRDLAHVALNNYEIVKKRKSIKESLFNIFVGDAAEFDSYVNYNYFYMYNPFDGEVMQKVISRIIESQKESNRKIYIVYKNPLYEDVIEKTGCFTLVKKCRDSIVGRKTRQVIHIYESK